MEFETLEELFKRVRPALTTKKNDMHRNGYNYIKEEDIWNYLKEVKWINSKNLFLYDMVSDIINIDDLVIDNYVMKKLNGKTRAVYFNEHEESND